MDGNSNKSFENNSLCDRVRFAITVGDELEENMNTHLNECSECRTFLEQFEKTNSDLSSIVKNDFSRNGKTVADFVIDEINKQSAFVGERSYRKGLLFRHAGLIAACLVLMVMAFPVFNYNKHETNQENSIAYDFAGGVSTASEELRSYQQPSDNVQLDEIESEQKKLTYKNTVIFNAPVDDIKAVQNESVFTSPDEDGYSVNVGFSALHDELSDEADFVQESVNENDDFVYGYYSENSQTLIEIQELENILLSEVNKLCGDTLDSILPFDIENDDSTSIVVAKYISQNNDKIVIKLIFEDGWRVIDSKCEK